jgi:hypothetical protein
MKGYRKMISDNIPKTWDIALRYCKCRKKYIERIYSLYVVKYKGDVMHTLAQKKKLIEEGIHRATNSKNPFSDSLELDRLRNEKNLHLLKYWENIVSWVAWFSSNTLYIKDDAKYYYDKGVRGDELVSVIANRFDFDPKLVKHILKQIGYELDE